MIIGKAGSKPVRLDLKALVTSRLLIQGNSGAGKSHTLRKLLELTAGKVQQIIIDIDDEFHTLREAADYVLASNDGGDCPAEPRSARLLARKLLKLRVSAIVGLHELSRNQREQFVKTFLEALMDAPKRLWGPLIIAVDEAHLFCPESGKGKAESTAAVIDLMTRGRKRGFCGILATQRVSKLNKDATTQANNLLVGRCVDVDAKRAGDELGMMKADYAKLKRLQPGQFYAFGPALCSEISLVKIGRVKTTHPEAGHQVEVAAPSRKIKATLAKLADIPEKAAAEIRDLHEAKAEITKLRRENTRLKSGREKEIVESIKTVKTKIKVPTVTPADLNRLDRASESVSGSVDRLTKTLGALTTLSAQIGETVGRAHAIHHSELGMPDEIVRQDPRPAPPSAHTKPNGAAAPAVRNPIPVDGLNGAQQRVLNSLAWWKVVGVEQPARHQVAFVAGYTVNGHFNNTVGALRSMGLAEYPGAGMIRITPEGEDKASAPDAPPTETDLHRIVFGLLDAPKQKLLTVLLEEYPNTITRPELAERTGYTVNGHFSNTLGALKSLGLATYPAQGSARASGLLFFGGRQ